MKLFTVFFHDFCILSYLVIFRPVLILLYFFFFFALLSPTFALPFGLALPTLALASLTSALASSTLAQPFARTEFVFVSCCDAFLILPIPNL